MRRWLSAMPSDVRKVYDLPASLLESGAAPQKHGHSPYDIGATERWGIAATAHRAAQPKPNLHLFMHTRLRPKFNSASRLYQRLGVGAVRGCP